MLVGLQIEWDDTDRGMEPPLKCTEECDVGGVEHKAECKSAGRTSSGQSDSLSLISQPLRASFDPDTEEEILCLHSLCRLLGLVVVESRLCGL